MKLQEYLTALQALVDQRPETLDFEVITTEDIFNEGNRFTSVSFKPGVGYFEHPNYFEPENVDDKTVSPANAVCLN